MEKTQEIVEKMRKTVKKEPRKLKNPAKVGHLTMKMLRFCEEYVKDLNATKSAIRAGYSEKTAYAQGNALLKKPEIKKEIDRLNKEISEKNRVTAESIVADLIEVKDRCMQKAPVMTFDYVEKEMVQAQDEEGRDIWKFDAAGANKSLELLGKHLGIFVDRKEVTGRRGGPLQVKSSGVLLVPADVALTEWQKSAQRIADDLEKQMMKAIAEQQKKENE